MLYQEVQEYFGFLSRQPRRYLVSSLGALGVPFLGFCISWYEVIWMMYFGFTTIYYHYKRDAAFVFQTEDCKKSTCGKCGVDTYVTRVYHSVTTVYHLFHYQSDNSALFLDRRTGCAQTTNSQCADNAGWTPTFPNCTIIVPLLPFLIINKDLVTMTSR